MNMVGGSREKGDGNCVVVPDIVGCVETRVIPCLHTATETYKTRQRCGKEFEDKLDDVFWVFF